MYQHLQQVDVLTSLCPLRKLLDSARESKEIWSEEESLFISKKGKPLLF